MNDTIHHDKCPLCGGKELVATVKAVDHLSSQREFAVVECAQCGFRFTQDAPNADTIGRYYESPQYKPHNEDTGLMDRVYARARSFMLSRKARLIHRHVATRGTLIDIGAGAGHFLEYMMRQGWKVKGCEQSAQARASVRDRIGVDIEGDVAHASFADGEAQVITLWHAMEHIHDLDELWHYLYRWLADDGLLVVALPNSDSADARHYGGDWAAYDVPRHLWHFTPRSFRKIAADHGFALVAINRLPLDAFYISLLTEHQRGTTLAPVVAACKGLWFTIKAAFDKNRTSSLVYLLKKQ